LTNPAVFGIIPPKDFKMPRIVRILLPLLILSISHGLLFAHDRRQVREHRQEHRQKAREHRQEHRQDRREHRQENRKEMREHRQDRRQKMREKRSEQRKGHHQEGHDSKPEATGQEK